MTFGIARGVAMDALGNVQTGVWVEVRRMVPGYPLAAPLYEDSEGAATLDNPFFSTSGEWEFYAVGDRYRVRVYKTGFDKTWDNVPVGTAQAADIDAYAAAGFTWAPESATATPPSDGCIRFNNASVASATHIYVDQDTLSGADAGTWLTNLAPGGKSVPNRIMISTSDSEEVSWAVSAVTDAGTYIDITVTDYVGPAGPIDFGDSGFLTVSKQMSGSDGQFPGIGMIYDAVTSAADPGAGKMRFNNATHASATAAYIDNVEALAGASITTWLDSFDNSNATVKGQLFVAKKTDPAVFRLFNVTGSVVDSTGYRTLTIAYVAGAGSLTDQDAVVLGFTAAGNDGSNGSNGSNGAGFTAATATVAAYGDLAEATNNGLNRVRLTVPASLTGDRNFTLPDVTGTAVVGSLGSTDNALLRADGTGAATAQGSAITVDDSGNMSGVGTLSAGVTTIASSSNSGPLTVSFSDDGAGSGPIVVYDRVSASPAASDLLGGFYFNGRDSNGNGQSYARVMAVILSPTDAAENGRLRLQTVLAGTIADRMLIEGGVYHSSATGGDKGNNTINFGAVYDDNTLLTCMALQSEFLENGEIDLAKWDALVPDQIVPESREEIPVTIDADVEMLVDERAKDGSLVRRKVVAKKRVQVVDFDPVWDEHGNGVDAIAVPATQEIVTPEKIVRRTHRTARLFKDMVEDGFDPRDPEQYFARMRADEALPGMPTKATWEHNSLSIGEIAGRKWLAMEMLAIVCNVMWGKLLDHEQRIQKLEKKK